MTELTRKDGQELSRRTSKRYELRLTCICNYAAIVVEATVKGATGGKGTVA